MSGYDTNVLPRRIWSGTFRFVAGYFYSTSKDGVYGASFHQFGNDWHLEDGTPIKIVAEDQLSVGR